jgi:hypothetical protein
MAVDPSYNTKNYTDTTGEKTVIGGALDVESGGSLNVKSGGALDIESGADLDIESGASIDIESGASIELEGGSAITAGSSASPVAINTVDQVGIKTYWSTTATSGTNYGIYNYIKGHGAGVEAIATRSKTLLDLASVGNAHGAHDTLELDTSAGDVTGLGTGCRGNVVVADRAVAAGTYYGVMAEIYPLGNTAALPAGSNACLGINAQPGTANDAVVNAISFSGTDGATAMIRTMAATPVFTGYIRILVNGAIRYIPFSTAQGAT